MSYAPKFVGNSAPMTISPADGNRPIETIGGDQDPFSFQFKRILNFWVPVPIMPGEPEKWSFERMKSCITQTCKDDHISQEDWTAAWNHVNDEISRKYYGVCRAEDTKQPKEWETAINLSSPKLDQKK